jgi:hypothetical protein
MPLKKSNTAGITVSDFILYYRAILNKNSMELTPKQTHKSRE